MSEKITTSQPGTVDELKPDSKNFNKHTEYGMALLEKSLRQNGAGRSILVDKDNNIIAGNGIVEAAQNAGITKTRVVEVTGDELVVVKRTDLALDSKAGREMALADNATAAVDLAWDFDAIAEVETEFDIDASDWGVVLDDEEEKAQNVEDDNFNANSETIETQCQRGEIWQLGSHRLMCGDSTSAEDVARLMDGENAPLTLTDPPYRLITDGGGVLKDSTSMKQVRENGVDEFEPLKLRLYSKTNIYTHNKPLIKDYILLAEREGMAYDLCIYKKPGLPNYNGHLMTDIEYIAIIGEQDPQKGYDFQMYSKVYEGKKDKGNELSYSKPIGLCQKFIQLYSKQGNIVLDLFGGTGTTMIACEQLNRKCFMMELDPHYCDVIIARWEKLTGLKAQILTNGE